MFLIRYKKQALHLTCATEQNWPWLRGLLVNWLQGCESRRSDGFINSDLFQAQIQDFDLTYSNIYHTDKLLQYMRRQVLYLHIENYSIFMTQSNNRISEKSLSKVPLLIEQHKPETQYHTNKSLKRTSVSKKKKCRQEDKYYRTHCGILQFP